MPRIRNLSLKECKWIRCVTSPWRQFLYSMLSLNHTNRCVWNFMLICTWMSHFWCVNNKLAFDAFWRKITTLINSNDRLNTTLCGEAPVGPLARADRLALCRKTQIRVCNFYVYEYSIYGVGKEGESPEFSGALHHQQSYSIKKCLGNLLKYCRSRNKLKSIFWNCHKECCMSKSEGLNYIRQVSRRCNTRNGTFFPAYFLQCTMEKGLPSSAIEKLS